MPTLAFSSILIPNSSDLISSILLSNQHYSDLKVWQTDRNSKNTNTKQSMIFRKETIIWSWNFRWKNFPLKGCDQRLSNVNIYLEKKEKYLRRISDHYYFIIFNCLTILLSLNMLSFIRNTYPIPILTFWNLIIKLNFRKQIEEDRNNIHCALKKTPSCR